MRNAWKLVAGSVVVYFVSSACSAEWHPRARGTGDAGVLDALTNPVQNAEASEDGSRLRARYYRGEDGSRQFMGWRDTSRNEECAYAMAADGRVRCLPTGLSQSNYYLDANCARPLFVSAGCDSGLGIGSDRDQCGVARNRVYALTAISMPSTVYAKYANCTTLANPYASGYRAFSGTEIAATEFVAASIE